MNLFIYLSAYLSINANWKIITNFKPIRKNISKVEIEIHQQVKIAIFKLLLLENDLSEKPIRNKKVIISRIERAVSLLKIKLNKKVRGAIHKTDTRDSIGKKASVLIHFFQTWTKNFLTLSLELEKDINLKNYLYHLTVSSPTRSSASHISNHHSACLGHLCGLGYELRG